MKIAAKTIITICALLTGGVLHAQEPDWNGHYLPSAASPRGNYIYLFQERELAGKDSVLLSNTAYFTIERIAYKDMESNAAKSPVKNLGKAAPVSTQKELDRLMSAAQQVSLQQSLASGGNASLLNYIQTHHQPSAYGIAYQLVETKQALGHVFLDEEVGKDEVYVYTVTRVLTNNQKEEWGYAITKTGSGNYTLPYFKPALHTIVTTDSVVQVIWKMPVPAGWIDKLPKPAPAFPEDKEGAIGRTPFSPLLTRATLYTSSNGKTVVAGKLLPVINATQDTATFQFVKSCVPEEAVTAWLVTEDEVYNTGIASDTAAAYALNQKIVPLVYGIRVKEVLNGIRLSWDAVPAKPYITGIEIGRYNSQDQYDSVATVPASDTTFTDYKVAPGQQYRYGVRVLFLPQLNVRQEVPANGVGSFTVFNRPLPVNNLAASTANGKIKLTWDKVEDPSFYASYIYRGTSANNLELAAGPVKSNEYTDTAGFLSARAEYYYAVVNQNLREDTSILSEIVKIVPEKKIEIVAPSTIDFYYANGSLRVSWNDVRTMDNAVESFIVMKKTGPKGVFAVVTPAPVSINNWEDTAVKEGVVYEYKVAAVSFRGDTSEYSNAREFTMEPPRPGQVNLFYVRNISSGIQVSLPAIQYENRKGYIIYRREASEQQFRRIATLNASEFEFTDKAVQEGKVYVYGISVIEADNREGARGKSISVRRKK